MGTDTEGDFVGSRPRRLRRVEAPVCLIFVVFKGRLPHSFSHLALSSLRLQATAVRTRVARLVLARLILDQDERAKGTELEPGNRAGVSVAAVPRHCNLCATNFTFRNECYHHRLEFGWSSARHIISPQ
jgi:hypothetical protein